MHSLMEIILLRKPFWLNVFLVNISRCARPFYNFQGQLVSCNPDHIVHISVTDKKQKE